MKCETTMTKKKNRMHTTNNKLIDVLMITTQYVFVRWNHFYLTVAIGTAKSRKPKTENRIRLHTQKAISFTYYNRFFFHFLYYPFHCLQNWIWIGFWGLNFDFIHHSSVSSFISAEFGWKTSFKFKTIISIFQASKMSKYLWLRINVQPFINHIQHLLIIMVHVDFNGGEKKLKSIRFTSYETMLMR